MGEETNNNDETVKHTSPLIVDFGRRSHKSVSDLKKGKGDLMEEVMEVIDEVSDQLSKNNPDLVYMPVVIVVQ